MISLVAGGLIAVAFTLVGMSINRRFKMRKEAFASLYDFSVKLKGDISYLKTNLPSVIKSHFENNKSPVAQSMLKYAENPSSEFVPEIGCFKESEKKEVTKYIYSIGSLPYAESLNMTDRMIENYKQLKEKSETEAKKLGSMYFKLLVLLGFAIMLIVS